MVIEIIEIPHKLEELTLAELDEDENIAMESAVVGRLADSLVAVMTVDPYI